MSIWGKLSKADDDKFNELYGKYVPGMGKAATIGGEILRAINRIVYRYYNDGDTIERYGGNVYNHNRACDTFLVGHCPAYHTLGGVSEYNYEPLLCQRLKAVLDYLVANPNVFEIPNSVDCLDDAPYEPWATDEYYDDWDDEDY